MASKLFKKEIPLDPAMALLNLKPEFLTHSQFNLLVQLFTAAKQTLAKAWRSPDLVINKAVNRMNNTMSYAKLIALETNMVPKFEKIWQNWIDNFISPTFDKQVLLPC